MYTGNQRQVKGMAGTRVSNEPSFGLAMSHDIQPMKKPYHVLTDCAGGQADGPWVCTSILSIA